METNIVNMLLVLLNSTSSFLHLQKFQNHFKSKQYGTDFSLLFYFTYLHINQNEVEVMLLLKF